MVFKKLYHNIDLQNLTIGLIPKETNSFTAEGFVINTHSLIYLRDISQENISSMYMIDYQ